MPAPRIAIVGRPNVGKSSLLNLMARQKIAIVDDMPGVTRDRVSVVVDLESPDNALPSREIEVTDTGGYGVYTAEGERFDDVGADLSGLRDDIEQQISNAVATADIILFVLDTQAGLTRDDELIAQMLRSGKLGRGKVVMRDGDAPAAQQIRAVATKVDGPKWEPHAHEFAALGFGVPMMVSSKNNYFRRDFLDALYEMLPEPDGEERLRSDMNLAIIGKRNAGKSSLVNALAGEARVIVSEIAGTTRDAVDVRIEVDDKSVTLIDTAGLRKKKSFHGAVEWYAYDRAKRAIGRSDAIVLLIDAESDISQVDEQLAMLAQKAFKPVVIAVNKWDLVQNRRNTQGKKISPADYEEYIRRELKGLSFAPIAIISAQKGLNLRELLGLSFELLEQASTRESTGKLNRLVREIVERQPPTSKTGTRAKVYYAAQVRTNPPTIAVVVNHPDLFTSNYERYMMNRFREALPYPEVPIRLIVRGKRRVEDLHRVDDDHAVDNAEEVGWTDAELASLPDEAEAYFDED